MPGPATVPILWGYNQGNGGHRFRLPLEDFLYFVIGECGSLTKDGWERSLLESHADWLQIQCAVVVRDHPEVAAETLKSMGYTISSPAEPSEQLPGPRVVGEKPI